MNIDSFTRQDIINLKAKQASINYDPHILNTFYVFLKDCGLAYSLDKMSQDNKRTSVIHIFESVFIDNTRCPLRVNMNDILAKFMSHVVYEADALKEKTTRGLVQCFNDWIVRKETLDSLGVQLDLVRVQPSREAVPTSPRGPLETWSDDIIQHQASLIEALNYKGAMPGQAKGYSARIMNELKKRNLNTYVIDLSLRSK